MAEGRATAEGALAASMHGSWALADAELDGGREGGGSDDDDDERARERGREQGERRVRSRERNGKFAETSFSGMLVGG